MLVGNQSEGEAGWIDWSGGECPVPAGVMVNAQLRDETREEALKLGKAEARTLMWDHVMSDTNAGSGDIIAYRVVQS